MKTPTGINRDLRRADCFSPSFCDLAKVAALALFVLAAPTILFADVNGEPQQTGMWDKVDIIAKIFMGLLPVAITWGIHSYNKQQRELENERRDQQRDMEDTRLQQQLELDTQRRENEFTLRQLETAREFLPHLTSKDTNLKWAAIDLIRVLGNMDLASKMTAWFARGLLQEEDRKQINRFMKYKDPHIAELFRQAFGSDFAPEQMPSLTKLAADYKLETTDRIPGLGDIVFHDDAREGHGRWVKTRGEHTLVLPEQFRMGRYLVTNEFFLEFVEEDGYATESYWGDTPSRVRARVHERCLSQDGRTIGPSTWPSEKGCLDGRELHPVAGIGYYEALAFCNWLQEKHPPSESGWRWCLPTEDMWELSARTGKGLSYPWGSDFSEGRCNSVEAGVRKTTDVNRYSEGVSGCFDMAGNVWEYVEADVKDQWSCVLKGGSFRNNKDEVKSYLRLFGVPREHRPPDFGFRCAQLFQGDTA